MRWKAIPGLPGHVAWFFGPLLIATAFVLWLLAFGHQLPSFGDTYRVRAIVANGATLTQDARVTMSGAPVGIVRSVKRRGVGAIVDMEITDDTVTPIARDSHIRLRARTALGENYVEIEPGTSSTALRSGDVLPLDQADTFVDVDQILSTFRGRAKDRARALISGLGEAVAGRGAALNTFLGETSGTLDEAARVATIAADHREEISRLIEQLGSVSAAVGERQTAVRQIGRDGVAAMRAVADRDAALRALVRELPGTLDEVKRATQTVDGVTDVAAPVLSNLALAVREVRPAVAALAPAATEGRAVLSALGDASPGLERTLAGVRALAPSTVDALPPLRKTLCELNPTARFLQPYTDDVLHTLIGLASASNSYDAIGHLIRLAPTFSDNSAVGLPPEISAAAHTLLHTGFLSKTNGLTYNAYPKPGSSGTETALDLPSVLGPAEYRAKTGYVFPRVKADC